MAQVDFNPVSGGDGSANNFGTSSWSNAHTGTGGTTGHSTGFDNVRSSLSSRFIERTLLPFDTSSLPANAVITAAILKLYRDDVLNTFANTDSTSLEIVTTTQASSSSVADADYGHFNFTSKGTMNFSSTSNGAYNDITITDLTIVQIGGTTKLGVITGRDLSVTEPTGSNLIAFQAAAGAHPPILRVTYTVPTQGGAFLQNFI